MQPVASLALQFATCGYMLRFAAAAVMSLRYAIGVGTQPGWRAALATEQSGGVSQRAPDVEPWKMGGKRLVI